MLFSSTCLLSNNEQLFVPDKGLKEGQFLISLDYFLGDLYTVLMSFLCLMRMNIFCQSPDLLLHRNLL